MIVVSAEGTEPRFPAREQETLEKCTMWGSPANAGAAAEGKVQNSHYLLLVNLLKTPKPEDSLKNVP